MVERVLYQNRVAQWVTEGSLGFNLKVGSETCHLNFYPPWRGCLPLPLFNLLTDWCSKSSTWRFHRLTKATCRHILSLFADQSRGMNLQSTDRCQCCLTFVLLMGTEVIDCSTAEPFRNRHSAIKFWRCQSDDKCELSKIYFVFVGNFLDWYFLIRPLHSNPQTKSNIKSCTGFAYNLYNVPVVVNWRCLL